MSRAKEYEIRQLDRILERLEAELLQLRHCRAPMIGDCLQPRADQIADVEAQIADIRTRLVDLLA